MLLRDFENNTCRTTVRPFVILFDANVVNRPIACHYHWEGILIRSFDHTYASLIFGDLMPRSIAFSSTFPRHRQVDKEEVLRFLLNLL